MQELLQWVDTGVIPHRHANLNMYKNWDKFINLYSTVTPFKLS